MAGTVARQQPKAIEATAPRSRCPSPRMVSRHARISAVTLAEVWRRGQIGWPRRFPIAQFPNPPLLVALAGWLVAAVTGGAAHDVGRILTTLGLVVWACEEIASGVNWFRRLLGLAVLAWVVVGVIGGL